MKSFLVDEGLILRDAADGAETSSTSETGIALDVLKAGTFHVVVDVKAIDTADGTETYAVSVSTDSEVAFGDDPVLIDMITIEATGRYVMTFDSDLVAKLDPDAAAIRVGCTVGGDSPSITYGAFIAPVS